MIKRPFVVKVLFSCLSLSLFMISLNITGAERLNHLVAAEGVNTSKDVTSSETRLIKLAVITCTDTTNIPTAGSIEWYIADITTVVRKAILTTYTGDKFFLIPDEAISAALNKNGYDMNALEMPDKEDIIKSANDLTADAVLVIELSSLGVVISKTSYQFYAIARYRAYLVKNNRYILRRFIYEGPVFSNKAPVKEQKDKLMETITATIDTILANCMFDRSWNT